jgi:hypothetical protein
VIGFMGLHTEKGGICAHRDVDHKSRDQGPGNRE